MTDVRSVRRSVASRATLVRSVAGTKVPRTQRRLLLVFICWLMSIQVDRYSRHPLFRRHYTTTSRPPLYRRGRPVVPFHEPRRHRSDSTLAVLTQSPPRPRRRSEVPLLVVHVCGDVGSFHSRSPSRVVPLPHPTPPSPRPLGPGSRVTFHSTSPRPRLTNPWIQSLLVSRRFRVCHVSES